jgi:hypothetical protein
MSGKLLERTIRDLLVKAFQKAAGFIGLARSANTGMPPVAAKAEKSHFLILCWTGVGQTGFMKPTKLFIC